MRIPTLMTMLAAPLALTACGDGENTAETADTSVAANMPMESDMPMIEQSGTGQTASTEGSVTAVDEAAGTITIRHGPVPAVNWPAMTMAFKADDTARRNVAAGDDVAFEFRITDSGAEIVSMSRK